MSAGSWTAAGKKRRGIRAPALLLGALVAAVVLAACGGGGTQRSGDATPTGTAPTNSTTPTPLDRVIANLPADFQISVYQGQELLGGQEIAFSSLFTQGKPVVLNFWAGLCPPCVAEMPDLQETYQDFKGEVILFGLDVGPFKRLGSREDGRALLEELEVTYPAGTTFDAGVVRDYRIFGMPTTFFILPDGKVLKKWGGFLTKGKMTELVQELVVTASAGA